MCFSTMGMTQWSTCTQKKGPVHCTTTLPLTLRLWSRMVCCCIVRGFKETSSPLSWRKAISTCTSALVQCHKGMLLLYRQQSEIGREGGAISREDTVKFGIYRRYFVAKNTEACVTVTSIWERSRLLSILKSVLLFGLFTAVPLMWISLHFLYV